MRTVLATATALSALGLFAVLPAGALAQQARTEVDVIRVTSAAIDVGADEVAGAVEVVDRRHIEDNLSGSLADTIAHEPGVSTTWFGPAASRPVIRGLGSDRVRVLVNGVGLIDASTNSPDHAVASEALEAERVEILRGPAAIAYGGGAIGGVVNVIDGRIPEERAKDGIDGRFFAQRTSVDVGGTAAGRVRFNAGELVFNLEALTRTANDYSVPGDTESIYLRLFEEAEEEGHDDEDEDGHGDEHPTGSVANSGLDFNAASAGVSWVGERGFIGVSVKRSTALYGVPGGHPHGDEDEHEDEDEAGLRARIDLEQTRYDLRGEWRDLGRHIERVRFSFGVGDYEHVELEGSEIGTRFTNSGWEGRVEARHVERELFGGTWEGAGGVQAFNRDFVAAGEEAFVPASETRDWGVFLVERWDAEGWGLEGGLRFENRELETAVDSRSFDTRSMSGSVFFRPQRDTFLAFTVSSSERAPTDVELFADGPHAATRSYEVGNPDLSVESALSAEFTARTSVGEWELVGAIFHADYDGFIAQFATGEEKGGLPVFAYRQQDAILSGIEGRIEGSLGRLGDWDIGTDLVAEYVEGELASGDNLPRIPPLSATLGLTASTERHDLRLEAEWADVQNRTAGFEFKTQSYVLVNARWSIEPFPERGLRVVLEGRNLTDTEARVHASFLKEEVPLPGRNLRAALILDF